MYKTSTAEIHTGRLRRVEENLAVIAFTAVSNFQKVISKDRTALLCET